MKSKIKKIIIFLMSVYKIKNIIFFESNADYSDNTRAFYEYLIKQKYNEKYKMYWLVNDGKKFKDRECKNVKFITMWHNTTKRTFFQWIKYFWLVKNARYLISSNRALLKLNKKTTTIYLNHGTPLKSIKDRKIIPKDIDIALAGSDFCIELFSEQTGVAKNKFICVGSPRDDVIFSKTNIQEKMCKFKDYNKIILWLPTFRKSANTARNDSKFDFPLGLPIIYSEKNLKEVNEYLKKKNILILFKLHPAQDTSVFKANSLSNIVILDDSYLIEKNVELCELFKITSAMITDYSSIYYDYLQTDKIVGFTVDDFEEYKEKKGFAFDDPLKYMAGEKIKNITDLYKFIDIVDNNIDKHKKQREKMKKTFNKYSDNKSSKRLAEKLKL